MATVVRPRHRTYHQAAVVRSASTDLPSLTSSLPVGPIPSTVAAAAPGGGGSTFSITIDRIEITALDGDAEEIGASISEAVGRHMRALVEQTDTRVRA